MATRLVRTQRPRHPWYRLFRNSVCRILCELARFRWARWLFQKPPPYDPAKWNDGGYIQTNNNCYNYGCDIRTDTFAIPGRASQLPYIAPDCIDVRALAVADGLQPVPNPTQPNPYPECCHLVALVIAPEVDFHFYRLDDTGGWSHKVGSTPARNTDEAGNAIVSPETAERGVYTEFCGYFYVCVCEVEIA
jgi:hypothetical protein